MDWYQENNTHPFGSLRDFDKAKEIAAILQGKGIVVEIKHDIVKEEYILSCVDQRNIELSRQVFLEVLGLSSKEFVPDPIYEKIRQLPLTPLTMGFIAISILVYLLGMIYSKEVVYSLLYISSEKQLLFYEIKNGSWYRLLSPMFLHFNFMHILFNLLWLKDLGKIIESKLGPYRFLFLIVSLALATNLLQYLIRGPYFGGMSGVVYGLLGYLWMAKTFEKKDIISLPKRDIYMMVGWFILCFTGVFGPIANLAHGMGLTMGMIIGLWPIHVGKKSLKWLSISVILLLITIAVEVYKTEGIVYYQAVEMLQRMEAP